MTTTIWKNYSTQFLILGLFVFCAFATVSVQFFTTTAVTTAAATINQLEQPPPTSTNGIIKRVFNTYGGGVDGARRRYYDFVTMGAYRIGINEFAIIGLSLKSLHENNKPSYLCNWESQELNKSAQMIKLILPDEGYGRLYTTVVVICKFPIPIYSGGKLLLQLGNQNSTIDALIEPPKTLNFTKPPTKYDLLYCGSPIFGNLSPQRVREWIAYHVALFGERSHFVIHDAGGVHEEVMEVLKPWIELGYVTLMEIKDQERFDGYYHNQFMVVNDCLHRYRFMAKWIFFFDLDEFVSVPENRTLESVLESVEGYSQLIITQKVMSSKICLSFHDGETQSKWDIEKMVYKEMKRGIKRDVKYAIQPRKALATGVHLSKYLVGKTKYFPDSIIQYYHFHGTIAERRQTCTKYVNSTQNSVRDEETGTPYILDPTLGDIAGIVKRFEFEKIGSRLLNTSH